MQESQSRSEFRIVPHGTIGIGNTIIFNVTSTSKRIKQYNGEIVMRSHQTVGDLINAVAKQVHLTIPELRVYRLGKEMTTTPFQTPISQLNMLGRETGAVFLLF